MALSKVSSKYSTSPIESPGKSYAFSPEQSGLYGISRNLGYESPKPFLGSYGRSGSSSYASSNSKYHSRSYGIAA